MRTRRLAAFSSCLALLACAFQPPAGSAPTPRSPMVSGRSLTQADLGIHATTSLEHALGALWPHAARFRAQRVQLFVDRTPADWTMLAQIRAAHVRQVRLLTRVEATLELGAMWSATPALLVSLR